MTATKDKARLAKDLWAVWSSPTASFFTRRQKFYLHKEFLAEHGIPYPSQAFTDWLYENNIRHAWTTPQHVVLRRHEYW
jgi:hypothetical protein